MKIYSKQATVNNTKLMELHKLIIFLSDTWSTFLVLQDEEELHVAIRGNYNFILLHEKKPKIIVSQRSLI